MDEPRFRMLIGIFFIALIMNGRLSFPLEQFEILQSGGMFGDARAGGALAAEARSSGDTSDGLG